MSYDIYIGEAVPTDEDGVYGWQVARREHAAAPCFVGDEMTGKTNVRCPSYGGWSEFLQIVGLYALFFDKREGLMRDHPGIQPLRQEHLEQVREALSKYVASNKKARPGWGKGEDPLLARLLWLEWWFDWTIRNCARPAIYNH